ncbi:MAG TPA: hypothetical protein VKR58_13320 [Aquella sp.]|nr:hypothetical protein [Aquella sp.]
MSAHNNIFIANSGVRKNTEYHTNGSIKVLSFYVNNAIKEFIEFEPDGKVKAHVILDHNDAINKIISKEKCNLIICKY